MWHFRANSNFNYCHIVWHFCSKKIWKQSDPSEALNTTKLQENCRLANTDKLEKLLYRALRIVFNDFTSSYGIEKNRIPKESPTRQNCKMLQEPVHGRYWKVQVTVHGSLIDKVKLPPLHLSRLKTIVIETFKCLHNISLKHIQNWTKV
jgi:hypothetical protein